MKYLSEGWPSKYDPTELTRRTNRPYMLQRAQFTRTSQQLGSIRAHLIELAMEVAMQPPLTRQDIRLGKRSDEIEQQLGQSGTELLAQHASAVNTNSQAMVDLRQAANKLHADMTDASEVLTGTLH